MGCVFFVLCMPLWVVWLCVSGRFCTALAPLCSMLCSLHILAYNYLTSLSFLTLFASDVLIVTALPMVPHLLELLPGGATSGILTDPVRM